MKINDLKLVEAPAGLFQQAGRRLGAAALGMMPGVSAQSKSAELSGRANQGATANQLLIDFSKWIGQKGKNVVQATSTDLNAYLQARGIQSPISTPTTRALPKAQLDQIFRTIATQQLQTGTSSGSPAPASGAKPATAAPAQAVTPPKPAAPVTQPTQPRVNPAKLPGAQQYGNGNWKIPSSDPAVFLIVDRSGKIVSLEKAQSNSPPPPHLTDEETPRQQPAQATPPAAARAPRAARPPRAPGGGLVSQMKSSD